MIQHLDDASIWIHRQCITGIFTLARMVEYIVGGNGGIDQPQMSQLAAIRFIFLAVMLGARQQLDQYGAVPRRAVKAASVITVLVIFASYER